MYFTTIKTTTIKLSECYSVTGSCTETARCLPVRDWGDRCMHVCACVCVCLCVSVLFTQPCSTLCDPVECSQSGSSVHGISQVKILEGVAFSCSWGSSRPRNQTCVSCIGRWILHHCATWECHQTTTLFISTNAKTYQTCQVAQ